MSVPEGSSFKFLPFFQVRLNMDHKGKILVTLIVLVGYIITQIGCQKQPVSVKQRIPNKSTVCNLSCSKKLVQLVDRELPSQPDFRSKYYFKLQAYFAADLHQEYALAQLRNGNTIPAFREFNKAMALETQYFQTDNSSFCNYNASRADEKRIEFARELNKLGRISDMARVTFEIDNIGDRTKNLLAAAQVINPKTFPELFNRIIRALIKISQEFFDGEQARETCQIAEVLIKKQQFDRIHVAGESKNID